MIICKGAWWPFVLLGIIGVIALLIALLAGCSQGLIAEPPHLLREFVPPPDAKIAENGEAPVLAAAGLPAKAAVLLADIHDPKQKEGIITHFIAVRPEGFQPVRVGREDIGEDDYGEYGKSQKGLSTNFDMPESDLDQGSRPCWLSNKPPLLLITGVEYGAGIMRLSGVTNAIQQSAAGFRDCMMCCCFTGKPQNLYGMTPVSNTE